jgi:hypothetical protein
MGTTNSNVIKTEVEGAAKKAAYSPVMEALTRVGYGVRGLIYIMMGLLALSVTLGKSGAPTDQQGAIAAIGRQPAGMVLLWVVLIGLVSYSLWGVIRAVLDPLHKGHDPKGLIERGGFLFSAAGYILLIPSTYGFISGAGSTAQNKGQTQLSMASVMSTPLGRWAIAIIGMAVIVNGIYQIYTGFNASFDKQFSTYAMTPKEVKLATQIGRIGTATRGFVFALVGVLLFQAGLQSNSSQGIGIDSALTALLHQPYGIWLLGIVGVGLIAFGVFSMLSAVWFRMKR